MRTGCIVAVFAALILAGCNAAPKIKNVPVTVISSKPYRYIKPSPKDHLTKGTLRQIERHNETHYKVKQSEKRAKEKARQ